MWAHLVETKTIALTVVMESEIAFGQGLNGQGGDLLLSICKPGSARLGWQGCLKGASAGPLGSAIWTPPL